MGEWQITEETLRRHDNPEKLFIAWLECSVRGKELLKRCQTAFTGRFATPSGTSPLSDAERLSWCAWRLIRVLCPRIVNGGFAQYFWNSASDVGRLEMWQTWNQEGVDLLSAQAQVLIDLVNEDTLFLQLIGCNSLHQIMVRTRRGCDDNCLAGMVTSMVRAQSAPQPKDAVTAAYLAFKHSADWGDILN